MSLSNLQPSIIEYPLLRSAINKKPLTPNAWIEELEKEKFSKEDITGAIYFNIFVISSILKTLSCIYPNEDLNNITNKFYKKNGHNFIEKYFKIANQYEKFNQIVYLIIWNINILITVYVTTRRILRNYMKP